MITNLYNIWNIEFLGIICLLQILVSFYPWMYSSLFEQVTVQDVSTMIRYGQNPIIFLINNGVYTIEVKIHDGPYNVIKNWNYIGLVDALHNGEGKCWIVKVFFIIYS